MSKNNVKIGTSGWNYKHWVGSFYPEETKQKDFLKYYSGQFRTVEVNNTFYQVPKKETITNWVETVPEDFIFAVKGSRYITHMKKLKDPEDSTTRFFEQIEAFKKKTGPILFQFPPSFGFNPERLEHFIQVLPKDYRYTFEFRDPNWFNDRTYNVMKDNNIAFCMYYMGEHESPKEITADFVYIRLHGSESLGAGPYLKEKLSQYADNIKSYIDKGKEVFCYFNNDEAGYAPRNAAELRELLG